MPALRGANDRFWRAIRMRLGQGPDGLDRDSDLWDIWRSPDLLLAQTCGLPYRGELHRHVQLVGTPDYGVAGCPAGYYRSVLIARARDSRVLEEFAGAIFAYNDAQSQSGWAAALTHFAGRLTFKGLLCTASHAGSARAIADNAADLASIDAVTWEFLKRYDPVAAELRVVGTTACTPGLPFITARKRDPARIAAAVRAAIGDLDMADRQRLRIRGLIAIPPERYLDLPTPPGPDSSNDRTGRSG